MAFDVPVRNRGRFNPLGKFVVVVGTRRLTKGKAPGKATRSRMSEWWRRGWITRCDDDTAKDNTNNDSTEGTIVAAEEGARGWWTVTYEDGSTKKMRHKALVETGYFDTGDDSEEAEDLDTGDDSEEAEDLDIDAEVEVDLDTGEEDAIDLDIDAEVEVDLDTDGTAEDGADEDGDTSSNTAGA